MAPACLPCVFKVFVDNPDRRHRVRDMECVGLDEPVAL
jgi:hypothetical protein